MASNIIEASIEETKKKNNYEKFMTNCIILNNNEGEYLFLRKNNSFTEIEIYAKIFGDTIKCRDDIKKFSLDHLCDEDNKCVIIKGGDFDIFSGKYPDEAKKFSEAYLKCAETTKRNNGEFYIIFDSRVKKGGDQLRKNFESLKKLLKDKNNCKIVHEGTYFHGMLFEKQNNEKYLIIWESKVQNKEDGSPGRIDGFPHEPELSTYTGYIISPEHNLYDILNLDLNINKNEIDENRLKSLNLDKRNDIKIDNSFITFLGLSNYLKYLAYKAENIS